MEYFENKSLNVLNEDKECQSNKQFELTDEMKEKLINIPQVIEFIEKLLKFIEKQKNKINKLIKKSKQKHKKDVEVQTNCDANNEENVEISSQGITKTLVDDIKDAAEQAMQNSGFVYEETSGMYYDYSTGYYYNAEYGLYYDGNSGTYLKYNQDTQSYEYHSQVTVENIGTHNKAKRKSKSLKKIKARKRKNEGKIVEEFEEGECSDSSSIDIISSDNADSDSSDVTTQWPPCMRIIVEDTSAPKLKIGSLHILTYEGGSIGREGDHAIIIPDINISKHHLNISFNKETNTFQALDIGSRNGTLLNGQRMSPSKQESKVFDIKHGSKIQLGSTILLCHVHDGHQTCGHCEPGLIEHIKKKSTVETKKVSKSENHKKELQNLKKKFGMSNFAENNSKLASGYTDRAKKRRETVGSQNPHEKTQSSSVEESIPSENIGFKLLSKMGWKEGESLGKEGQGILEPINLVSNEGTSGVGCINKVSININKKDLDKKNVWSKAQQRFDKLSEPQNDFDDTSQ